MGHNQERWAAGGPLPTSLKIQLRRKMGNTRMRWSGGDAGGGGGKERGREEGSERRCSSGGTGMGKEMNRGVWREERNGGM